MFRKILMKIFFLWLYIMAILISCEVLVRAFSPQPLVVPMYNLEKSGLNYSLKPNVNGWLKSGEFGSVKITTNSHGLREKEVLYEPLPNTYRILILGDSTTFGWGVSKEERFSDILESILNESHFHSVIFKRVEVINCGVGGYGTADELRFFTVEGVKYKPNLVILVFGGADPLESAASGLFKVKDNRLEYADGVPGQFKREKLITDFVPLYQFLCQNSHFINFLRRNYIYIKNRTTQRGILHDDEKNSEERWKLTFLLIKELKEGCGAINADLLICELSMPALEDYERLRSIGQRLNLGLIKEPHFKPKDDVYKIDGHINARGHRKVAENIAGYLISHREKLLKLD